MEKITQVIASKVLRVGCSDDKNTGWLDFSVDAENTLRLAFPVEYPPEIKLALQLLQKHISEERQKVGLPAIEHSIQVAVKQLEFWRDDLNQVAGIRCRFENGGSTDTPIAKDQLRHTIEFLSSALASFEDQSPKH